MNPVDDEADMSLQQPAQADLDDDDSEEEEDWSPSTGKYFTPIAFDERVTFWLQRARSLPCACAFSSLCDYI